MSRIFFAKNLIIPYTQSGEIFRTMIELWIDINQGYCKCLLELMVSSDVDINDVAIKGRNVRLLAINRDIDASFFPNGGVLITDATGNLTLGTIGVKRVIALRRNGSTKAINPQLCKKCFDFSGIYQTQKIGASEAHVADAFVCSRCDNRWEYGPNNPQS